MNQNIGLKNSFSLNKKSQPHTGNYRQKRCYMNSLILSQQDDKTMSSMDLFVIVNQSRESEGENKTRLNQFNNRIMDELEGEHYQKMVVENLNGTESFEFKLTIDQCMLIAMRESKAVRKAVLHKIRELESKQSFQIPQTLGEALQLAADQAKQLEAQAPKVAFVDNCVERGQLMTATQVAQKHKLSAVKLNKFLDELGGVYNKSIKRGRAFLQEFIDHGLGEMKQTELGYSQALFTAKGEQWINEKLISEGVV